MCRRSNRKTIDHQKPFPRGRPARRHDAARGPGSAPGRTGGPVGKERDPGRGRLVGGALSRGV
ncbi:MAG: hypothetical protein BJ554DRAFT_8124 [Olpidium bornovanus]|uniref:Uncharacterized protein n=1 Tax=Olpidium bornovanus TaxID=278681 RepID=A0A8H8DMJ4_9FUNG|nr:MAG: hypothetical protein BJ554DRAFT_8124 [Olpidium bornovanus]